MFQLGKRCFAVVEKDICMGALGWKADVTLGETSLEKGKREEKKPEIMYNFNLNFIKISSNLIAFDYI